MNRARIRMIMGVPTAEYLDGKGGVPQDQWHAYQFSITAFYEDKAQVTDPLKQQANVLEPDSTGTLDKADAAIFPCGTETIFQ